MTLKTKPMTTNAPSPTTRKVTVKKAATSKQTKAPRLPVSMRRKTADEGKAFNYGKEVYDLDPNEIVVDRRLRKDFGDITALTQSIKELGQIHAIRVTDTGSKLVLEAGERRLRACQALGIRVRAEVYPFQGELLSLRRQCDENFQRKSFDALEESDALVRLKAQYDRKHEFNKEAPRFTKMAAAAMNISERRVYELLEFQRLPPDIRSQIEKAETPAERTTAAQKSLRVVRNKAKLEKLQAEAERRAAQAGPPNSQIVVHHGDNRDYLPAFENQVDLVITDPPYGRDRAGVNYDGARLDQQETESWDLAVPWDWIAMASKALVPGGSFLSFCPLELIGQYEAEVTEAGLEYRQVLIWHKTNPVQPSRPVYPSSCEAIVWATKPGKSYVFAHGLAAVGGQFSQVVSMPGVPGSAKHRVHPTQKPDALIDRLVRTHSVENSFVLDPFAGSGTTGVICHGSNRRCVLIEKDAAHFGALSARLRAVGAL